MDRNLKTKISRLKDYFLKRPEVIMAFVFGSYANNRQTRESDFDVAVYFKPKGKTVEWEEVSYYEPEDEIWVNIEKIIGLETDLVVLNRVSSTLAFSVIREGIPVVIKDKLLYQKFLLTVSSAAEYFREFINDFWMIKQRSMSLTDEDRERLIKMVDFFEAEIGDYAMFVDLNKVTYESDTVMRRNVERWVENIVNTSIDIAKIVLASEKKRIPQTYREVLQEMSLLEGFSGQTAENLARFAKLRNILAHEYLDIRFKQIDKFIKESEEYYKELLSFIKGLLK